MCVGAAGTEGDLEWAEGEGERRREGGGASSRSIILPFPLVGDPGALGNRGRFVGQPAEGCAEVCLLGLLLIDIDAICKVTDIGACGAVLERTGWPLTPFIILRSGFASTRSGGRERGKSKMPYCGLGVCASLLLSSSHTGSDLTGGAGVVVGEKGKGLPFACGEFRLTGAAEMTPETVPLRCISTTSLADPAAI